jgi:hypothetical protein
MKKISKFIAMGLVTTSMLYNPINTFAEQNITTPDKVKGVKLETNNTPINTSVESKSENKNYAFVQSIFNGLEKHHLIDLDHIKQLKTKEALFRLYPQVKAEDEERDDMFYIIHSEDDYHCSEKFSIHNTISGISTSIGSKHINKDNILNTYMQLKKCIENKYSIVDTPPIVTLPDDTKRIFDKEIDTIDKLVKKEIKLIQTDFYTGKGHLKMMVAPPEEPGVGFGIFIHANYSEIKNVYENPLTKSFDKVELKNALENYNPVDFNLLKKFSTYDEIKQFESDRKAKLEFESQYSIAFIRNIFSSFRYKTCYYIDDEGQTDTLSEIYGETITKDNALDVFEIACNFIETKLNVKSKNYGRLISKDNIEGEITKDKSHIFDILEKGQASYSSTYKKDGYDIKVSLYKSFEGIYIIDIAALK